ncbi:MAG: DUF4837 family protein [Flavobacteriia bacterium]|nr:DUF4837 family protein [Flavobacteriia bacterium]NCT60778.1 DUF4837 family protein [Flavobacteriia bacterium]PIV95742.1 MAG: DUF4837 domain-containing protein [Flavobacteriaceae bacterium CG17_big_fil_post_rev_8_21_14_2_50_31_13]PIY15640.1 MAG: DUF4837 domain-containing protein [Flavobacteriaceae bacterium CG_4_10_14_3_um_filter_31_253]
MKNILFIAIASILLISCTGNDKYVLKDSIGSLNKVMVVAKVSDWTGDIGQEIRTSFGELMVGLPQPEPILTLSQVAPSGFSAMMKAHRNLLIMSESDNEGFSVRNNVFAQPQTIVYVQGKDDETIIKLLQKHKNDIKEIFIDADIKFTQRIFEKNKLAENQFKTIKNLGISLTIPTTFKLVEDTGEFLWLRQHLLSGIAKTGSNNILVYSIPLENEETVGENIVAVRDSIGKKYIPGSFEGMYMITEAAYTPFTFDVTIDGKKAYETRGKWEVKDDFMAGPFLNYSIIDKKNNRVVVFEGFTYSPSVNKRAFVFELEAIAKSIKIN